MTTERPLVYLDNAATTFPKPEVVYKAMDDFYRNFGGNAGRGANPLARRAAALVDETRSMLQAWLNAPEVIFVPSATIALNVAILGARLRPGDIVYVTPFEHNSVSRPLEYLRQRVGIEIQMLPFDRATLECKLDEVESLFKLEPPAMVCVTQVSNVFGITLPVDAIMTLAKKVAPTAITLVDGAQAAGLKLVDMSLIDGLIFSGHKSLYGPYGVAGIAFGRDWRPEPLVYGGTGTQSESLEMPQYGPSRLEAGSHNISAIAGLNASLKWLNGTGREAINAHTQALIRELIDALSGLSGVRVYTPKKSDTPAGILSFTVDGVSAQSVETALGAQNIAVRAGLHCAPWAHEFVGTLKRGGTVRVSVGNFNSEQDGDHLAQELNMII